MDSNIYIFPILRSTCNNTQEKNGGESYSYTDNSKYEDVSAFPITSFDNKKNATQALKFSGRNEFDLEWIGGYK